MIRVVVTTWLFLKNVGVLKYAGVSVGHGLAEPYGAYGADQVETKTVGQHYHHHIPVTATAPRQTTDDLPILLRQ